MAGPDRGHRASASHCYSYSTHTKPTDAARSPPDASYPGPLLTSFLVGERVPCPYMYGEIGSQARVAGCAAAATSYGLRTRAGDAALREVESR
ncbi:hypothetical protein CCMA1212_000781 [Trichoderma ghanense]|uniref:Uncharacterized protein n=1 Tax=Trichoderma ghanense TaxID=65468 RepID=A0ABY2HGA0_9HYPO